jgi:hypothetical protein
VERNPRTEPPDPRNLCRLLRLSERAKRKEPSAKRNTDDVTSHEFLPLFTFALCGFSSPNDFRRPR